jgi:hypothetical protein
VLNNKIQDDHNISPNLKLEYMGEQISSVELTHFLNACRRKYSPLHLK